MLVNSSEDNYFDVCEQYDYFYAELHNDSHKQMPKHIPDKKTSELQEISIIRQNAKTSYQAEINYFNEQLRVHTSPLLQNLKHI